MRLKIGADSGLFKETRLSSKHTDRKRYCRGGGGGRSRRNSHYIKFYSKNVLWGIGFKERTGEHGVVSLRGAQGNMGRCHGLKGEDSRIQHSGGGK